MTGYPMTDAQRNTISDILGAWNERTPPPREDGEEQSRVVGLEYNACDGTLVLTTEFGYSDDPRGADRYVDQILRDGTRRCVVAEYGKLKRPSARRGGQKISNVHQPGV